MGLLFTLIRVVIAVLLCVVISRELPTGCSGVLPAEGAPVPRVSALFLVLAVLPEPFPQIALLWRTTSASCCVLTVALSVVHPHTAMLYFAWAKGYAHHHPALFALAAARALLGAALPALLRAGRPLAVAALTLAIDALGRLKRPRTPEQQRAHEAARQYVLARAPSCRCPAAHCTCGAAPVRVRVKRVNTLRGTLKWLRRWLTDAEDDDFCTLPSAASTASSSSSSSSVVLPPSVPQEEETQTEESKKDA